MDKIVEVPQIQTVDRIVRKPVEKEVVRHVYVPVVVDVPVPVYPGGDLRRQSKKGSTGSFPRVSRRSSEQNLGPKFEISVVLFSEVHPQYVPW